MSNRVLIIAPKAFGIITPILKHFESLGFEVRFVDDRFDQSFVMNFILRYFRSVYFFLFRRFIDREIRKISGVYDGIVFINAEAFEFVDIISLTAKCSFSVFYTWDSVANKPYLRDFFRLDAAGIPVATFDPDDAEVYGVQYLPLFSQKYENEGCMTGFDACFIGTMHSGRLKFLSHVLSSGRFDFQSHYFCLFCKNYFIYFFYLFLNLRYLRSYLKFVKVGSLSLDEFLQITWASDLVIDFAHPSQCGLTHRSVTALFNGKSVLTNNRFFRHRNFAKLSNNDNFQVIEYSTDLGILDLSDWLKFLCKCL